LEQLVIVGSFGRFSFVWIVESTPTRSMRIRWLRDGGAVTLPETVAEDPEAGPWEPYGVSDP
jgi:hypothetical protein